MLGVVLLICFLEISKDDKLNIYGLWYCCKRLSIVAIRLCDPQIASDPRAVPSGHRLRQ